MWSAYTWFVSHNRHTAILVFLFDMGNDNSVEFVWEYLINYGTYITKPEMFVFMDFIAWNYSCLDNANDRI